MKTVWGVEGNTIESRKVEKEEENSERRKEGEGEKGKGERLEMYGREGRARGE